MDRLQRLADIQDCTDLVSRFARAIDRRDTALMEAVFHPDATDDHGLFRGTARDFIAWVVPALGTMIRTQHVIGQVLVELDGDVAKGESYFVAYHVLPGPDGEQFMIAAGRYLDRFERRDGQWKIAHRLAAYDWNAVTPSTDAWDRRNPGPMTFGTRDTEDASYAHFAGPALS